MNYPPTKIRPRQCQIDAWNLASKYPGFYIAHDMAVGKTKLAIDFCNGVNARRVIVICPKKVIDVWPSQFKTHSAMNFRVLPLVKGTATAKAYEVKDFLVMCEKMNARAVVVVNYDTFWRPPLGPTCNEKNKITNPGVLSQIEWDVMIADEGHRVKAPGGKASWGATRLAQSARRKLFLSGTPYPHSPLDIYAQFRAMDPTIFGRSFSLFKRRYCEMGGFNGKEVLAFINQDELNRKFYSRAHRVKLDDVIELPEAQDLVIECELDPKTMRIYRELEDEFISQVDGGVITAKNALDKLLRLSQLASGTLVVTSDSDNEKRIQTIDNSKIETVIDLIDGIDRKEPVVVFCRFREELRRLTEEIEKHFEGDRVVGEVSGRVKPPEDLIGGVWTASKTNTLLVQIQAGGEGLDFTAARYCIYLSMGYSLGQHDQSKARIRRPGQTRKMVYYYVIAKKTVDKKILKAIQKKREIVDYVLKKIQTRQAVAA